MGLAEVLQKRIRPRKDESDDEATYESDPVLDASVSSAENTDSEGESESQDASDTDKDAPDDEEDLGTISFGALAKAQETLGSKRKLPTDPDTSSQHREKRLRDHAGSEALERRAGKKDLRDFSRSSKHAPAELSSKKAVSRRREVFAVPKPEARDPRFEPLSGPINELQMKRNYAFLDTYRESEIADLKAAIRKTHDADAKDKLKRALLSMESRKKTQAAKDKEQEVLRKHRKKEKELIGQGKKPFYLKAGERKKMALVERFEGMKRKEADKVIERRRKKRAARERREMPEGRRGVEG